MSQLVGDESVAAASDSLRCLERVGRHRVRWLVGAGTAGGRRVAVVGQAAGAAEDVLYLPHLTDLVLQILTLPLAVREQVLLEAGRLLVTRRRLVH